jgi:hypothetical protein
VLIKERDGNTNVMDDGIDSERDDDDDSDFVGSRSKKSVKKTPHKEERVTWHYSQAKEEEENKAARTLRKEAVKAEFEKYLLELGPEVVFDEQITCDG